MEDRQRKGIRRKVEMKKIENERDRSICFSKRRSGIYKKANELVTRCGAEVGLLVFSPSGKPFSYAHPSIHSIINRFINITETPRQADDVTAHPLLKAQRQRRTKELNKKYDELVTQLGAEKDRGKALQNQLARVKTDGKGWWEITSMENLVNGEAKQVETLLMEFRKKLRDHLQERTSNGSFTSSSSANKNPFGGSASTEGAPPAFKNESGVV